MSLILNRLGFLFALGLFAAPVFADETVTVFAAASLTDALGAIDKQYQFEHPGTLIQASFASSGALAKQIDAGAPAQVFASADRKWVDFLAGHQRIVAGSRYELLGNALVLIAPKGAAASAVSLNKTFNFPASFSGKLCTGETSSVPVGIYAKQALTKLGWWDGLQGRVVGTEDVRGALAFVERGECAYGIVYQTDAMVSSKVTVVGRFPDDSHDPIVYPIALTPGASPAAQDYFHYLQGDKARAVFAQYGFVLH